MTDPHDFLASGPLSLRGIQIVLRGVKEEGRLRRRVRHEGGGIWELIVDISGRPFVVHQSCRIAEHMLAVRQAKEIWTRQGKEGSTMRPAATGVNQPA